MFKGFSKIIAILLIVALNWASLNAVFDTVASYTASASVTGITFTAGVLDFSLSSPAEFPKIKTQADVSGRDVKITNTGNVDFRYNVSVSAATTTLDVCGHLLLNASLDHTSVYAGKLIDFTYDAGEYATTTADWSFLIAVDDIKNLSYDSNCYFDLVFYGQQLDTPGFNHTEAISNHITVNRNAPTIDVIYPNGGQHWYVVDPQCLNNEACRNWCATRDPDKMNRDCQYPIQWTAHNPNGPDTDLRIDLYYSNDSGKHWLSPFAVGLFNTGRYLWMLPYDMAYVTHTARIKVVAYDKNNPTVRWEGQSANDFCPPMLSIEDLMNQIDGLENAEGSAGSGGGEPRARSEASVDPAEITPMPAEEITGALDEIRDATTSAETALGGAAQDAAPTPEIVPYAAPSDSDAAPTLDTITGPPAVIPVPSKDKNGTSTDTLVS